MSSIWVIAKRELNSYFDSLIAYIIIIIFLAFNGFFTWFFGSDIFIRQQADLSVFFGWSQITLFFFIPAITMRQFAEEKRSGTIELLLTKAVSNRQVVLGKFLSCFLLVAIAVGATLAYYITVANLGNIDHGATICGYLGILLLSAAYISIGLFSSSLTNNQIVALLISLVIGLFFQFLFEVFANASSGFLSEFFSSLSIQSHFESISRGVLDSKDLIFFFSIIILGLFLSEWMIARRS